jgi:hypothetical protein
MSDSILDDVRAAAGQASDEGGGDAGDAAADVLADVAQAADAAAEAPDTAASDAPEPSETPAQAAQRARDEAGRFAKAKASAPVKPAPKTPAAPAAATGTPPPASAAAPAPPAPPAAAAIKAPQAWTPAAREAFSKAPPEVQAEVDRREREMARFAQQSAPHRQLGEGLQRVLEPYRALLTDEPLKVVGNLLQTAAQLQTAPPAHKAQLVATLVKQYGIPIDALDAALAGVAPQAGQGQQPGAQPLDEEGLLRKAEERIAQRLQQQRAQTVQQAGLKAVQDFLATEPEFLEDVRDEMADLIETRARRGIELKPADAYTLACKLHPEISQVLQQREAAKAANAHQASTQSKRLAASSVRGQPAGVQVPKSGGSVLDDVQAAATALNGR